MARQEFTARLAPLHLLSHPFYQDWMAGRLTRAQLKDYSEQYYAHVAAFPRYLSAIHSLGVEEADRRILLENLNDEEGVGFEASHPELWMRFAEGMGSTREEVRAAKPRDGVQNVMNTFFGFARRSFHEGLGALYAYESQVPEIAESKILGLRERYGITDTRTLEFFEIHRQADVAHREALEVLLERLTEQQKQEALNASIETAQALWNFLSEIHDRNTGVAA